MIEEIITGTPVSEQVMLIGGIIMEIPILMVLLSRILDYRINRWANIIIGAVIIALIIGVGSKDLDDIFFATIEVIALSAIIWLAVKWREPKI
jgi:Sec-independent protein secretion pathway component TatC